MQKVSILGAASMAEALIAGFLKEKLFQPHQLFIGNRSNHARLTQLKRSYLINTVETKDELIENAEIVILAVKPKDAAEALHMIQPYIQPDQLILSVIAGIHTETISQLLEKPVPVVRAMPNTSASIGKSATAIAAGQHASQLHIQQAEELFQTVGTVSVVPEQDLDAVTGLSGSGPAYVYYLVEAMEKAAASIGLGQPVAKELILQTIIGAAEMLKTSPKHPSELRREVTSPGGTTEAGVKVLEQFQYQEAMISCIEAATKRSAEMGAVYKAALKTK